MLTAFVFLAAAPAATPAPLPDGEWIVIFCDPHRYRWSVRAAEAAGDVPADPAYPQRIEVEAESLMQPLPGYGGANEVAGPLIRYVRCGPYTIRLIGDAYNPYVQGEAGAYPSFAAVRVLRGNSTIYPWAGAGEVRLTACDRSLPRARPCPDGYIVRLDGAYDARRKQLDLREWSASYEDDPQDDSRRETQRSHTTDDDLDLWRPE